MENKTITLPQWAWNFIIASLEDAETHASLTAAYTLKEKLLEIDSSEKSLKNEAKRILSQFSVNKEGDFQTVPGPVPAEIEVIHGRPSDAEGNIPVSTSSTGTVAPLVNQPSQPIMGSGNVTLDNIDQLSESLIEDATSENIEVELLNTKGK